MKLLTFIYKYKLLKVSAITSNIQDITTRISNFELFAPSELPDPSELLGPYELPGPSELPDPFELPPLRDPEEPSELFFSNKHFSLSSCI